MANLASHPEWSAWDWLEWHPESGWKEQKGFGEQATKDYIGFGNRASPVLAKPGIHICFLPRVNTLAKDKNICKELTTKFSIPNMFWEATGWDGNGYFWARTEPDSQAHAAVARFLVKEVNWDPKKLPGDWYDWLFFGFASFWQPASPHSLGIPSAVFLVFDTIKENGTSNSTMMSEISQRLQRRTDLDGLQHSPFGIYVMIMEPLLHFFDKSLWGFRVPIRDLEKHRLSTETATRKRYEEMHELSRHIIHASETIDVAAKVLERMADCQMRRASGLEVAFSGPTDRVASPEPPTTFATSGKSSQHLVASNGGLNLPASGPNDRKKWTVSMQIQEDLLFYASFFTSLKLRASAFERRLENEIQLAHHTVTAGESRLQEKTLESSRSILSEMKSDGRNVAKLVSYLSILFLPGSFLTGLFGMNMLTFAPTDATDSGTYWSQNGWQVSKMIWIPATSILIATAICWSVFSLSGLLRYIELQKRDGTKKDAERASVKEDAELNEGDSI